MDTKRLILAIALSVVVILAYQYFFMPKPKPIDLKQNEQITTEQDQDQNTIKKEPSPESSESSSTHVTGEPIDIFSSKKPAKKQIKVSDAEVISEDITDSEVKEIVVETDLFKATFTNQGAGLKSFVLKKYKDDAKEPLNLVSSKVSQEFGTKQKSLLIYPFYFSPFEKDEDMKSLFLDLNFQKFKYVGEEHVNLIDTENTRKEIIFEYANVEQNLKATKRFIFSNSNYVYEVQIQLVKDGQIIEAPIVFGPDLENNVSQNRVMQSSLKAGTYNGQELNSVVFSSLKTQETEYELVEEATGTLGSHPSWSAYDTNYFAAIFKSSGLINYKTIKIRSDKEDKKGQLFSYIIFSNPHLVFMGPKDEEVLENIEKDYQFQNVKEVVNYGWGFIGAIASIMLKCIVFIYGFIPNYGWALVIFTIFIKIILFPLTYTSSVSMAKMQTLQPKIKAIKNKYKNIRDPQQRKKMNEETMALYRSEKVNPAGGCLPLLLQMPILFAFFRLLPISINFRHEAWMLWITDLSVKDPIYLLPILMGATQIVVSKMSPTTADNAQKKLMYIMPVVFVVLFMNYSAGLNLYWFVSNLLQIGQQYIINQKIFKHKKEEDRLKRAQRRKKRGKA